LIGGTKEADLNNLDSKKKKGWRIKLRVLISTGEGKDNKNRKGEEKLRRRNTNHQPFVRAAPQSIRADDLFTRVSLGETIDGNATEIEGERQALPAKRRERSGAKKKNRNLIDLYVAPMQVGGRKR